MNWVAIKETDNDFSIRSQYLLSLTDICILSFSNSLRNSYKQKNSFVDDKSRITDIVDYLKSFPFSNPSQSILPFWISDLLFNQIFTDEDCPTDFFTELFSEKVCCLSNLTWGRNISSELVHSRISLLKPCCISKLDFSYNLNVTDSVFVSVKGSQIATSLKTLNLRGCTGFNRVSSLACFGNLVDLDLSENESLEWRTTSSCQRALTDLLSYFTRLLTLDLHLTNLFSSSVDSTGPSSTNIPDNVKLQELYLYMNPVPLDPSQPPSLRHRTLQFYQNLSCLPSLTHLDLSGWPYLEEVPGTLLTELSKRLIFFGLYQTPITTTNKISHFTLHCEVITGLSEEKYLAPTVLHYSKSRCYLKALYIHIFDNLMEKYIIQSNDTLLNLIPLVLDALDHYISLLPYQDPPSSWENLDLLISCTACLYALDYYMKDLVSEKIIRRSIETSVTLLHRIGVRDLRTHVGQLVSNTCSIYSLFAHIHSFKQSHKTLHNILCRFFIGVINRACDVHKQLEFSGAMLPRILDRTLRILYTMLFGLDGAQKEYVGIDLGGVDTLMRLIEMKMTASVLDTDLHHASGALMNVTYLCLPNCLRLSKREHSEILVRVLGGMSQKRELIALIMACLENIAEFCLQDESAGVAGQLLTPVITVLKNHNKYNQDAVSCAIAFTAYFTMGHEKWGWAETETREEALSLSIQVLTQLDYRISRSVSYNTLDFLVECLEAKDSRILLCGLWIICNLVYKSPEYYLELLSEEAVLIIRGIASSHPRDSMYNKLASEVVKLVDITRKCAELKQGRVL